MSYALSMRYSLWVLFALMPSLTGCDDPLPAEGSFSALTYNVHGLPPEITGDDTVGRMELIGPLLGSYDVVGAQEDFTDEGHAVLEAASDHAHKLRFADKLETNRAYGSGLTIFSRFGESEHLHEHFNTCVGVFEDGSDCMASKGFQVSRLVLEEGVEVDLYNTHLEAGGSDEDVVASRQQVEQLIGAMEGWSDGRALVLLGDTNLKESHAEDSVILENWLARTGLSDGCEAVGCSEPGRIDRVFFRSSEVVDLRVDAWAVQEVFVDEDGVDLSDHDAISVSIRWIVRPSP